MTNKKTPIDDLNAFKMWLQGTKYFTNFDNRCMMCGTDLFTDGVGFCQHCIKYVQFNNGKICHRCGAPMYGESSYCEDCSQTKIYYNRAYSAFVYEKALRKIIHSVKFGNNGAMCYQLAYYLAYLVDKYNIEYDLVVNVPMTVSAVKKRGFNQAKLLAQSLCHINDTPCYSDCLVKVRDTVVQEQLSRHERLTNLNGVYDLCDKEIVKGKKILLVDDVKTTGTTLNQCSKVLIKYGALEVNCITVASGEHKVNVEGNN